MIARIETKVWAAVVGSGGGATLGAFALWALGVFVWHTSGDAAHAEAAMKAVPGPVAALVALAFTAAGTLAGGYAAPKSNHANPREDSLADPAPEA